MIVDCAAYAHGKRCNRETLQIDHALEKAAGDEAFVWIGLYEPTESEFDAVKREFNLHELAVEDAIHAHQQPKLEMYGDTIFAVLKTARYVDSEEVIELGEILIFIGDGFIVTVRIAAWVAIAAVPTMIAGVYGMNFELKKSGWL